MTRFSRLVFGAAFSLLAAGVASAQEPGPQSCPTPESRDAAALDAARACVQSLEKRLGPDAQALAPVLDRLGDWFTGDPDNPLAALYFRRRALRLAEATEGPESPAAGAASLDLARSWILSGRCRGQDPRVVPLLDAAETAFEADAASAFDRHEMLLAVAHARADLLDYGSAADLLTRIPPRDASEWELLGDWRRRAGDVSGAADAWLEARTRSESGSRPGARLTAALRRAFFELGDATRLKDLGD